MTTILGEHISLIRPTRWAEPQIPTTTFKPKSPVRSKKCRSVPVDSIPPELLITKWDRPRPWSR